jgi:hypothetical protein
MVEYNATMHSLLLLLVSNPAVRTQPLLTTGQSQEDCMLAVTDAGWVEGGDGVTQCRRWEELVGGQRG